MGKRNNNGETRHQNGFVKPFYEILKILRADWVTESARVITRNIGCCFICCNGNSEEKGARDSKQTGCGSDTSSTFFMFLPSGKAVRVSGRVSE